MEIYFQSWINATYIFLQGVILKYNELIFYAVKYYIVLKIIAFGIRKNWKVSCCVFLTNNKNNSNNKRLLTGNIYLMFTICQEVG